MCIRDSFYVVLAALAMISAIMVSYARARAESLIGLCRVCLLYTSRCV